MYISDRSLFFYLYIIIFIFSFSSCKQVQISDARDMYINGNYYSAAETYRDLYRQIPREHAELRGVVSFEMAETYRILNRVDRAVAAYRNAIRYEYPDSLLYLYYAQMLHKEGSYKSAINSYHHFLQLSPNHAWGINGMKGAEMASVWVNEPSNYKVELAEIFNSTRSEFSPVLSPGNDLLYFTSSRSSASANNESSVTGMNYNDIFVSKKNANGKWQIPEALDSEINSEFDEGALSLTADGSHMFYTVSYSNSEKHQKPRIYLSKKINGTWTAGKKVDIMPNDTTSLFAHPAVSPSGKYIYFVSDMPGGYGKNDIWRALLSNSFEVISIENLGPEINTPGNEMFPYIYNDSVFYFSSDGHVGMGGLDIFRAHRSVPTDIWQIDNMKYPINSSADDFGITFMNNRNEGFFSSNRNDVRGYDHIYSFEYPEPTILIEGIVVDHEDEYIENAHITIVSSDGHQQYFTTNKNGEYSLKAQKSLKYLIHATAEGFLNQKNAFEADGIKKDTLIYIDFEMIPYNIPIVLEHIFYDFDSAELRAESENELQGLVHLLNEHPEIIIELDAHTDRVGSSEYNLSLSQRRVESVIKHLTENGVQSDRLTGRGFGADKPKTVNKKMSEIHIFLEEGDILTEEYINKLNTSEQIIVDQINRRTEFRVIKPNN